VSAAVVKDKRTRKSGGTRAMVADRRSNSRNYHTKNILCRFVLSHPMKHVMSGAEEHVSPGNN